MSKEIFIKFSIAKTRVLFNFNQTNLSIKLPESASKALKSYSHKKILQKKTFL